MEALLILSGILMLILGWLWLVISSMHRSVGRMLLALFFGPLTLLLRGLGYPLWPRLLMTFGLLGIISGGTLLYYQHPERIQQLLDGRWLAEPATNKNLRGAILGKPFHPNHVIWRGDDLIFEESIDDRIRRSLTIRFGSARELLMAPAVERLPSDQGAWPELILRWHTGALSEPGLRRITGDYSLNLDFARTDSGEVEGRIHLYLASAHHSWLSGVIHLPTAPEWMLERDHTERLVLQATQREADTISSESSTPHPEPPAWRELSLLALLDEPDAFIGSVVRLTTWGGRIHTGILKQLSPEKRLVLSIPQGANQIELHFQPLDVRMIEESTGL